MLQTEVPPEDSQAREIKLTVPIKGEHWCWLCKSHGLEKVCPRKDEIGTEYGRQRLKELLQEMVKSEERLKLEQRVNGITPVSYTHLRAHETLRYLVCRLLLEKKK